MFMHGEYHSLSTEAKIIHVVEVGDNSGTLRVGSYGHTRETNVGG
jgi:hypothetical protein